MKFAVQPGLISFSDDRPGAHATMFGPGGKLEFREDESYFHDADRVYIWAFVHNRPLKKGDLFVFATSDRETVGVVGAGGEVEVSDRKVKVVREGGKPVKFSKRLF